MGLVARLPHLARRFFCSLAVGGPSATDEAWAESHLLPGEVELWRRLSDADRRHLVGVARRVVAVLGKAERPVVAAALLHDAGKVDCGLGTLGRVAATLLIATVSAERLKGWGVAEGFRGRVGRYRDHPAIGERLLVAAGSDQLTATWAREHELPRREWTVDAGVAEVLVRADR